MENESRNPKIMVICDRYLPGFKSGGPIRSISNIVERLGDEFTFFIITGDRDSHETFPYPTIKPDEWNRVGKAQVWYLSPKAFSWKMLRFLLNATPYDLLYLNSFFSFRATILPITLRRLNWIPQTPIVLAPRGEFSDGALAIKAFKKRSFLSVTKKIGFYENMIWQASSSYEMEDIQREMGNVPIHIVPNIASKLDAPLSLLQKSAKRAGYLKIACLSRISPIKNLDGALEMLQHVFGHVTFDIFGPIDHAGYWESCQAKIAQLPDHIVATYKGPVAHDLVTTTLSGYHALFFPTKGENFGHVIFESLAAGCPVLISDQTPWRNLEEKGAGWDLPLSSPQAFIAILNRLVTMEEAEHNTLREKARRFAESTDDQNELCQKYRELFGNADFGIKRIG